MDSNPSLLPGRVLRRAGPPKKLEDFAGVQIDDPRLAEAISPDAAMLILHEGTLHGEGTTWDPPRNRLLWSDVSNRRLLGWYPDGRVEVVIDGTYFMNGNAVDLTGGIVHCEHGRRCISRSEGDGDAVAIVTHFEGKRFNSPNDITVAADGALWFTDPIFGLVVPGQGSLAEPELDHRSVYRFDPRTGGLARMADFEQPNGICFSRDFRTLYVSDTARALKEVHLPGKTHQIEAFDVGADNKLSNRRFFCHTDHGCPDGIRVDKRGWIWTTAGDGLHIYAPDRTRLGYIPTPEVAANCAFGGQDGTRLFIAASKYLLAIDLKS